MIDKQKFVTFVNPKTEESFESLKEGVFENKKLHKFISKAIDSLKENPTCGVRIANRLIPEDYIQKFKIDNLWKYNLPSAWRLLYTIKGDELMIISIILDWMSHKEYERKFKY